MGPSDELTLVVDSSPAVPGNRTWNAPYDGQGADSSMHGTWIASGFADRFSGNMVAMCEGQGFTDSKTRGEMIVWCGWSWNATQTGDLHVKATFMDIITSGFVWDPISQGTNSKYCVDVGYIWVGARNERTGEDLWEPNEIGRAPLPFVAAVPLSTVSDSGVAVQAGDEISFMVGICNYSSGKLGGTSHGQINARLHEVKAEIK